LGWFLSLMKKKLHLYKEDRKMKNLVKILVVWALGVFLLIPSMAGASYQFSPGTQVESYNGYTASGNWYTVIAGSGDTNFNIVGANLVGTTLEIFTGWKGPTFTEDSAIAADLTLASTGGTWMVRLGNTSSEMGKIYNSSSGYNNSQHYFGPQTGYNYGGAYETAGQVIPVWATGASIGTLGTTGVVWTDLGNTLGLGYDVWEVAIDLSKMPAGFDSTDFSFLYATGTCGNSVLTGSEGGFNPVPIPPSALLLGTGLLGLVGLGWRRRQSS
jgi:hypothetical protein